MVRPANLQGCSLKWHDFAILTTISSNIKYSDFRLSYERDLILPRFLNLDLSNSIDASIVVITVEGRIFALRIATIVANKPQERVFFRFEIIWFL